MNMHDLKKIFIATKIKILPYGKIKITREEEEIIDKMFVSLDSFRNKCTKFGIVGSEIRNWKININAMLEKADKDAMAAVKLRGMIDDFAGFLQYTQHNINTMRITRNDIVNLTHDSRTQLIEWFDINTNAMENFVNQGNVFMEKLLEG